MLIWSGLGAFAAVIPFFAWIAIGVLFETVVGPGSYETYALYVAAIGLIVSAPIVYYLGKRFEARPGRRLIDPATNEEVVLRESHTMFFISMKTWGLFYAILAPVVLAVALLG
jgi:hypothetical protein